MMLDQITSFVKEAHKNQVRPDGEPYFNHLERVRKTVSICSQDHEAVALLHDYLEDVEGSDISDLYQFNLSIEQLSAIRALTKERGESFDSYLERISKNKLACTVKAADRADNLMNRHPSWSDKKVLEYCTQADKIALLCPEYPIREVLWWRIYQMRNRIIVE